MSRPSIRLRRVFAGAVVGLTAVATAPVLGPTAAAGDPPTDPASAPLFERIDVDAQVAGASFSVTGEVFDGEQNIVTSGYGALSATGTPVGGGTVQIYRPGASLREWTKVQVIKPSDGIVFPNQVTLTDMDGDGDTDLLVPSGYFFDTSPSDPHQRSAITWWENRTPAGGGAAVPFLRHDVITGQAGSYHGVQHIDLDGDGIKDLVTTAEEAKVAANLNDDTVTMQVLRGLGGGGFAAPVAIGNQGGSIPVVADVDGDDKLDIISSQYFGTGSAADNPGKASFLWWQQTGDLSDGIAAGDFTARTIATIGQTGPGFQIRPVPDFRGDGELVWVGTNHTGRCTFSVPQPDEAVFEFTPGADITQQWSRSTLSNPAVPDDSCPPEFKADRTMIFPGDNITSRAVPGQAAPGVFGYGDVDGDGDTDLVVAGDGDHRLFWVEQRGDGSTRLHTLTAPGERFGQSGGAAVADFDGNGTNELVFSSFDRSTVALWRRVTPQDPIVSASVVTVAPVAATVPAGQQAALNVTLSSLDTEAPAERPSVQVTFTPARTGVALSRGSLALTRTGAGRFVGTWRERVAESGTFRFSYAGRQLDPLHRVGAAERGVRLGAGTALTGFRGGKVTTRKAKLVFAAKVLPAAGRTVRLQRSACVKKRGKRVCTWRTVKSATTGATGSFRVKAKVARGASKWRIVVLADATGTAATSPVRKVVRR